MITASAPTRIASIAGGPYSWSRRDEREGRVSRRSSGAAGSTSTSAAASELSITGVSEARDDEGVLVELVVDRGCDHVQVEPFVAQTLDPFRRGQRTHHRDRHGRVARR